jgi:hypothetical protein
MSDSFDGVPKDVGVLLKVANFDKHYIGGSKLMKGLNPLSMQ